MKLDDLVLKIRVYTPFVTPEYELYVVNGLYCRFGNNTLRRYKFKFPEDVDKDNVKLVYRTTYSGKLHYWDYTNNYPGHVREDSDVRPITKDQEAVLTKILEDFINSERE
jgi:hypothetical protein